MEKASFIACCAILFVLMFFAGFVRGRDEALTQAHQDGYEIVCEGVNKYHWLCKQ